MTLSTLFDNLMLAWENCVAIKESDWYKKTIPIEAPIIKTPRSVKLKRTILSKG